MAKNMSLMTGVDYLSIYLMIKKERDNMGILHVGYNNYVPEWRITSIVECDSSPIRRMIQEAKASGKCIDATCGRKTKSVIILDSGHCLLSAFEPKALINRMTSNNKDANK